MPKTALKTAGVVFLLVALAHLSRLVFKFSIIFGSTEVPLWANGLGLAIAGGLSLWMFSAAQKT